MSPEAVNASSKPLEACRHFMGAVYQSECCVFRCIMLPEFHEERAQVMKSRSLVMVNWFFLLVAVVFWISWFVSDLGWISLVVASISSVVFGVMLFLELFE